MKKLLLSLAVSLIISGSASACSITFGAQSSGPAEPSPVAVKLSLSSGCSAKNKKVCNISVQAVSKNGTNLANGLVYLEQYQNRPCATLSGETRVAVKLDSKGRATRKFRNTGKPACYLALYGAFKGVPEMIGLDSLSSGKDTTKVCVKK